MIELNCLSIGNWIKYREEIIKVNSISGPGIINGDIKPEDVEGIPISIEPVNTLLNLGFEKDIDIESYYDEEHYRDKSHRITLTKTEYMVNRGGSLPAWGIHVDNDCFDSIGSGDVVFIHEIQNFIHSVGVCLKELLVKE